MILQYELPCIPDCWQHFLCPLGGLIWPSKSFVIVVWWVVTLGFDGQHSLWIIPLNIEHVWAIHVLFNYGNVMQQSTIGSAFIQQWIWMSPDVHRQDGWDSTNILHILHWNALNLISSDNLYIYMAICMEKACNLNTDIVMSLKFEQCHSEWDGITWLYPHLWGNMGGRWSN